MDVALRVWAGKEETMFVKLVEKYGPEDPPERPGGVRLLIHPAQLERRPFPTLSSADTSALSVELRELLEERGLLGKPGSRQLSRRSAGVPEANNSNHRNRLRRHWGQIRT